MRRRRKLVRESAIRSCKILIWEGLKAKEWCKLVVVKNSIKMRVRGSGMREHPGKELGCADGQWTRRECLIVYCEWKAPVLADSNIQTVT